MYFGYVILDASLFTKQVQIYTKQIAKLLGLDKFVCPIKLCISDTHLKVFHKNISEESNLLNFNFVNDIEQKTNHENIILMKNVSQFSFDSQMAWLGSHSRVGGVCKVRDID